MADETTTDHTERTREWLQDEIWRTKTDLALEDHVVEKLDPNGPEIKQGTRFGQLLCWHDSGVPAATVTLVPEQGRVVLERIAGVGKDQKMVERVRALLRAAARTYKRWQREQDAAQW